MWIAELTVVSLELIFFWGGYVVVLFCLLYFVGFCFVSFVCLFVCNRCSFDFLLLSSSYVYISTNACNLISIYQ